MAKADLTAERLRELLDYDSETGIFRWKQATSNRVRIGAVAGFTAGKNGYRQIGVYGEQYYIHRLAWLYTHGTWPIGQIDHVNGNRSDNRIKNLRDVSCRTNAENKRDAIGTSLTKVLGVSLLPSGRWAARIGSHRKLRHIGTYDSPEEAHQAYLTAKRQLHAGCTI